MTILNIFSFFLLFLFIGLAIITDKEFFLDSIIYIFESKRVLMTFILIFGYMILHELLHSLAYYIYGAKYKNIIYGIQLEKGIFYCLCKQNIRRKNILNALFFPLFYIGMMTFILSFILDSSYLLILSIFNISGCAGDIMTFLFISRLDREIEFSEFDDTTSFAIYTDKEINEKKYFRIKYIKSVSEIKRDDLQKIRISKASYIIIVLLLIGSIIFNYM